jgi:hypothetical protein
VLQYSLHFNGIKFCIGRLVTASHRKASFNKSPDKSAINANDLR